MAQITTDPHAFKRAAKALSAMPQAPALSACQTALAKAMGYRDVHHQQNACANLTAIAPPPHQVQTDLVRRLHEALGINAGELLHALAKARFFGSADPADALRLREDLFAEGFPALGRSSRGTPCRLTPEGSPRTRALLIERDPGTDGLTRAMTDHAITTCVSYELSAHRDGRFFIPLRFWMPYGVWTEADGSQVLFSRDYCPLWKITADQAPLRDDPDRTVAYVVQEHFFSEMSFRGPVDKVIAQGLDILRSRRVVSTPQLVEWLPQCLTEGVWISSLKKWPWDEVAPRRLVG